MKKRNTLDWLLWFGNILLGSAIFALGFDLFLGPNDLNAGGVSGIAMILVHLIGFGSVGTVTMLINLPLFILGGLKIGKRFFVGSAKFIKENANVEKYFILEKFVSEHKHKTLVFVASDNDVLGAFMLSDEIRNDSADAVDMLKKLGVKVVMLTGDNESSAKAVAQKVGIDIIHHSLLPAQK